MPACAHPAEVVQHAAERGTGTWTGTPTSAGLTPSSPYATAHGETSDTRQVIGDLSDMLRAAWRLMTPEQRTAFREDPDVLGIAEAAGGSGVGANG